MQPTYILFKYIYNCKFYTIILAFPEISASWNRESAEKWRTKRMESKDSSKIRKLKVYEVCRAHGEPGLPCCQCGWAAPAGAAQPTAPAQHQQLKWGHGSQAQPETENIHTELLPFSVINTYREQLDPQKLHIFCQLIKINDLIKVISK